VSDLGKFLHTRASDYGSDSWMISTWSLYIGNRYSDSSKLDAASPAYHADQIKCPVLLIHAEGDTTVRVDQSDAMNDALTRLKKPVQFVKIDGDSHYMLLADTRIRVLKETEAFLQKNIGN
jgi:dipeptidyl aminopeptidase/acylaminoacyl peptidase